jgi:hypothetical protein
MKRSLILIVAISTAGVVTSFGSAHSDRAHPTPRSGALHVTKECGDYRGAAGEFCTILSSNIKAIESGMRVVYLQALGQDGSLDSDVALSAAHGSVAFGHVVLNSTTQHITLSGGTGKFAGFHADAEVSVDGHGIWHWDGTYGFTPG